MATQEGEMKVTPRQRQMWSLLSRGWDNEQIAATLVLSKNAVANTISRLYERLDLDGGPPSAMRVRAALLYLGHPRRWEVADDA